MKHVLRTQDLNFSSLSGTSTSTSEDAGTSPWAYAACLVADGETERVERNE